MVGRYQNQPVLGLEVGAARQGFHHVRHKAIRSFNGADVLRDGSIESVPMPIDVHVVKVQEYSVGITVAQNGHGLVAHGRIGGRIDGLVHHLSQDVVVDGSPMANRVRVEVGVFQLQAPHEGGEPLKVAAHEVVAGHAVGVRPHAANHRRPPRTAVGDVIVECVGAVYAICNQGVQGRCFGRF